MKNYNYKLHIARKPIIVYKLVLDNRRYSQYKNPIYSFNKEYTANNVSEYIGSFLTLKALDQHLYVHYEQLYIMKVAICIIPKGALYSIEDKCIISNKIIIKHIL